MGTETPDTLQINIEIPFPSNRHAEIAYDVLRIDAEPKRSLVQKSIILDNNILKVNFTGGQVKNLRVGVNSFFEHLILMLDTVEQFGPPSSATYEHY